LNLFGYGSGADVHGHEPSIPRLPSKMRAYALAKALIDAIRMIDLRLFTVWKCSPECQVKTVGLLETFQRFHRFFLN
jgi:hypothetical protein